MGSGKCVGKLAMIMIIFILRPAATVWGEEISQIINIPELKIQKTNEGYHEISIEGFGYLLSPGEPMLPYKTVLLSVPGSARDITVKVHSLDTSELDGSYQIKPAPLSLPMIDDINLINEAQQVYEENKKIYLKCEYYPESKGMYAGKGSYRGVDFVRVKIFPIAYNPVTKKLVYSRRLKIEITYASSEPVTNHENPGTILSLKTLKQNLTSAKSGFPDGNSYDYVIITTAALQSSVEEFKNFKNSLGFKVGVFTIEWIFDNYSGMDLAERIRNFLIDKYQIWGIQYVLLVGDVNDVPMRICYPKANATNTHTPTDYYYADLSGDWDADGDGFYGEFCQDSPDWVPEVIVGRIPWSDAATVYNICAKMMAFESTHASWKKKGLLLGAMSNYRNEDGKGWGKTDGSYLMEHHKTLLTNAGGTATTMYEKEGIDPSPFDCTHDLTHENVVGEWSSNPHGLINWWAHGSSSGAYRKTWITDDGDNVPESSANEFSLTPIVTTADCNLLNDNYPAIIFANSCDNGYPERNSLGRKLLQHGSAGVVASSRLSWYTVGWNKPEHGGNASIDYYFFHYLINENDKVGEALFDSKVYYSNHFMFSSWGYVCWQNLYDFNLYGDPAMVWQGIQGIPQNYSLAGIVLYQKSGIPVSDVTVSISGGASASFTTSSTGVFEFNSLPGGVDYILTVSKSSEPMENGILGFDAALAARIATGLYQNPTETELLAADVDKNGSVQLYDAALIAKYAVGIVAGSDSHIAEWVFKPDRRTIYQLNSNLLDQNFTAILLGDVDGNWQPKNLLAKTNSAKKFEIHSTDAKTEAGDTLIIPINLFSDEEMLSFDGIINYDSQQLKLIDVKLNCPKDKWQFFLNDDKKGSLKLAGFSFKEGMHDTLQIKLEFKAAATPGIRGHLVVESIRVNNFPEEKAVLEYLITPKTKPVPEKFALHQNFPNPFNPKTAISFDLPEPARVKLVIYNALGQAIRTLLDEQLPAGNHQVHWDGKSETGVPLSSGVYFYEIKTENFQQVRKMTLLR